MITILDDFLIGASELSQKPKLRYERNAGARVRGEKLVFGESDNMLGDGKTAFIIGFPTSNRWFSLSLQGFATTATRIHLSEISEQE